MNNPNPPTRAAEAADASPLAQPDDLVVLELEERLEAAAVPAFPDKCGLAQ